MTTAQRQINGSQIIDCPTRVIEGPATVYGYRSNDRHEVPAGLFCVVNTAVCVTSVAKSFVVTSTYSPWSPLWLVFDVSPFPSGARP